MPLDLTATRELLALPAEETRSAKKNYTEKISNDLTRAVAEELRVLGLKHAMAPTVRDRQFMGGYGSKGVDAYLADERHGLLLSSGTKGILFTITKNLKNRYRDMVMEALELHKRFPYAVCGHLLFIAEAEVNAPSRRFGTVLAEITTLLENVSGRERPDDPPELYEEIGILTLRPGDPESVNLMPPGVPDSMQAATYCERLVRRFRTRNPHYG